MMLFSMDILLIYFPSYLKFSKTFLGKKGNNENVLSLVNLNSIFQTIPKVYTCFKIVTSINKDVQISLNETFRSIILYKCRY